MMAAILNSAILDSAILHKKTSLIHSDSTWWWQPSWILPSWIQTPCFLLSNSPKNTLSPFWIWLKLIQSDSNSFILTQLDDGGHLEFCHLKFHYLRFSHLSFSSQTYSHLPRLVPTICTKQNLHSFILTQCDDGSDPPSSSWVRMNEFESDWISLSHSQSGGRVFVSELNSAMLDSDTTILDSDTMLSSLRFTQKHSHSTLTLTQTNSI